MMEEVERLTWEHYNRWREQKFKKFAIGALENGSKIEAIEDMDWESTFFLRHLPVSNMAEIPDMDDEYRLSGGALLIHDSNPSPLLVLQMVVTREQVGVVIVGANEDNPTIGGWQVAKEEEEETTTEEEEEAEAGEEDEGRGGGGGGGGGTEGHD
ncbi:hypothetical protein Cni_G19187 [Canna indica]|uniref:Uncharacterized protein n=1 Tax=Canna indica TaxID=4628 RepID=A0AAQ3KMQ1_9LILI|nr:hypothetical protein Cni_G19187 [Canna indica]